MIPRSSWATRLSSFAHFSDEDESLLAGMSLGSRQHRFGESFVESKDAADHVIVVVEGLACRSRLLPDGRRQILSYLFPGDMTSPERLLVPGPCRHPVSMLRPSQILLLDRADMAGLRDRPNICDALGRYAMVKEAIASEWQISVGSRTAQERIGHLLCEMYARLEAIGHAGNHVFLLPLTQCQLAESLALSAVHVNRVLMDLRRQKILAMGDGVVTILDYGRLCAIAGFDAEYLQVDIGIAPARRSGRGQESSAELNGGRYRA